MHTFSRRRDQRGAAAVEFALVLPVLLLVMFGIINFGVVFAQQISLSNGARQGARYAVTDTTICSQITSEARAGAGTIGMSPADVGVSVSPGCGGSGKPCAGSAYGSDVTVTTTFRSDWVIPLDLIPGFPSHVHLEGRGTFRCEFS